MAILNKNFWKVFAFFEKGYILYPFLFLLSVILFTWLQDSTTFLDPDAFYHAKIAELMAGQGIIIDFPWLQLTFLKEAYTDQHFLFHILTVPFISYFTPLTALKIISVLLSSTAICVIAAILRFFKVRGVFWWSLLLLTIAPFILRLSLAKASPLALLVLLLGVLMIVKKKYLGLFIISWIYVWSHGGFILIFFLACLYFLLLNLYNWNQTRNLSWRGISGPIAAGLGIIAGVIINPYFPQNISFYWSQVVEVGLMNYQQYFGVGAEWYPYNIFNLVGGVNFIFVLLIMAILIAIFHYHRQNFRNWYFLMIICLFLLFTLKSRRYIEYFVPFAFIWSILVIDGYVWTNNFKGHFNKFLKYWDRHKILVGGLVAYFAFAFIFGAVLNLYRTKSTLNEGIAFVQFEETGNYLTENKIEGNTIFHANWDQFPMLFYQNSDNYYLTGMDPTFSYKYDPALFYLWRQIIEGKFKKGLPELIQEKFGAEYVFIDTDRKTDRLFWAYLKRDPDAELIFEAEGQSLYHLK